MSSDIVALLKVRQPTFAKLTAVDAVQIMALRGDLSCSFAQPTIAHFRALRLLESLLELNYALFITYLRAIRLVELSFYIRELWSSSRTTRFQSAWTTLLNAFQFA